ncbi:NAD(P)/FAD-dependent oxidoreductase [Ktedonospora formicarum]|uniref:FAD-binding domain-containing protein n=1 Tax=Ktedonospora formicarum TaxID=2778364 RepID=A0A8J3MR92_9CHLR|nr:FAD-dependent monooxygenase [Ktedonospora formicarum]GHO45717.1 hypothetical protein KSX_38800 [Ktedonospora formicarum]
MGTPQAFHVHRLLPRGKVILERLFPGYIDDLPSVGGYPILKKTARMVKKWGVFQSFQPEKDVSCSRALLEQTIRQRVQILPGVRILEGQEVLGLRISTDNAAITGITLRPRGEIDQHATITAELVIDASGRTSKLTQWLQAFGYELPENEQVISSIGYSTRFYKASKQIIEDVGTIVVDEMQEEGKMGVGILPIENDRVWVTLFGIGGHFPSTDVHGFEQELANLHLVQAEIADALKQAQPLTTPRGYRVPICERHRYDRVERWPAGLLVMGDAFCHFDPIYGQGMTVAAVEAETLEGALLEQQRNPQPDFERRTLQRMQEAAITSAWWLSALNDLRGSGVEYKGEEGPQGVQLLHCYLDLYFKYALEHPVAPASALKTCQPTVAKLALMNGLLVPPKEVFNASTLTLLLEEETSTDDSRRLHELVDAYNLSPEAIMEQVLPAFMRITVAR